MMLRVLFLFCASCGLLASSVPAQNPSAAAQASQNYYDVVASLPWNAGTSGPVVAVCPAGQVKGKTLNEIGRKAVSIGGITAVVPTRMFTLNTRITMAPNLYDGLPRDAKVLYLLSLLSDAQWTKVTSEGLSLNECQGEQKAVMQSILPNPLRVAVGTVPGPNSFEEGAPNSTHELSDQERQQVRIHISRQLLLYLPVKDGPGVTFANVRDNVPKGLHMAYITDDIATQYNPQPERESDNLLKPSQLNFADSRLEAKVPLKTGEFLSELVARIATATGLELYVDPHYCWMRVFEAGKEASSRDLLQAASLGVAGTYRRLGDAYTLTCDLEGVAAHQARLAAWEDDVDKMVKERETLWRGAIAKRRNMREVGFNRGAFDSLTPAELENVSANDAPHAGDQFIATANASPAVRLEIQEFKGVPIDSNRVCIRSSTRYQLMLPDGSELWSIGWLAETDQFETDPDIGLPPKPDTVPLPLTPPASLKALVLRADSERVAREDVERVRQLGIGELWLETRSASVFEAALKAAAGSGIKVSAAIRPWSLDASETARDPDRTVIGDHGKALAAKKLQYNSLQRFWLGISAFEPVTRESLSPLDPAIPSRWSKIIDAASVKGLETIVLLDAYPTGYAKQTSNGMSSGFYFYSLAVDPFLSYGYSDVQRLAFLRTSHIDPLDIVNGGLRTKVDFHNEWLGWGRNNKDSEDWQKAKGAWIHDVLYKLVTGLSATAKPILLPGQPLKTNLAPWGKSYLSTWTPGSDLPVSPEDYRGDATENASELAVIEIQDENDPEHRNRVARTVKDQLEKYGKPVVLDFSSIPSGRVDIVLARWLKK